MKALKAVGLCMLLCAALSVSASADTVSWSGVNPGVGYFTFTTTGTGSVNINTVNPGTTYDTIVTLFDGSGNIVNVNDDWSGSGSACGYPAGFGWYCSEISMTLGAGNWTIGLSQYSNFANCCTIGAGYNYGTGYGAGNGNYVLTVSGENVAAETPEPTTLALLGTGLVGAALRRRKLKA